MSGENPGLLVEANPRGDQEKARPPADIDRIFREFLREVPEDLRWAFTTGVGIHDPGGSFVIRGGPRVPNKE